jgi:hypothetical protein
VRPGWFVFVILFVYLIRQNAVSSVGFSMSWSIVHHDRTLNPGLDTVTCPSLDLFYLCNITCEIPYFATTGNEWI